MAVQQRLVAANSSIAAILSLLVVTSFSSRGIKMLVYREEPDPVPLGLDEYLILTAHLPPPNLEQMHQFAVFVSHAHSWYKHIPMLPPGSPFQFFIDPSAGQDLDTQSDGRLKATERLTRGPHYSSLPTREHRTRFGYLGYATHSGWVLAPDGSMKEPWVHPYCVVFDQRSATKRCIPVEVYEAGRALVSGLIHPAGSDPAFLAATGIFRTDVDWPEDGGGSDALERIRARCRELRDYFKTAKIARSDDPVYGKYSLMGAGNLDIPLLDALEPERERQRAGMVSAMQRVVSLVYAGRSNTIAAPSH